MKNTVFAALIALISVPTVASAMTEQQSLHSEKARAIFAQIAEASKEDE